MTTPDFPITIYHNPDCGTSRNVLSLIKSAGYAPTIILYRETGWTRPLLLDLLSQLKLTPRGLLRDKGTPAAELGLLADGVDNETLLSAMVEHPILVNRPIVLTPMGALLARPSETVLQVLAHWPDSFTKEDGEVVVLKRS